MTEKYLSGNITIKNKKDGLDIFCPKSDVSSLVDEKTGISFLDQVAEIYKQIDNHNNSGGIEVTVIEPPEENTYPKNTLFAVLEGDVFDITIDTRKANNGNIGVVPIGFNNITTAIDWGDGTIAINSSGFPYNSSSFCVHTYSTPGIYNIKVKSLQWDNIQFYKLRTEYSSSYGTNYQATYYLGIFNEILISINKPLPRFNNKQVYRASYNTTSSLSIETYYDVTHYMFYYCKNLISVCDDVFKNYTNIEYFSYTFANCISLTTIPTDLFRYNTAVTSFYYCFYNCRALMEIPQDLFRYNINVTTFQYCFYRTVNNTFTFTLYIGSTKVSNCNYFTYSNLTYTANRKVYCLAGSTTYSSFYNQRNNCGISVYSY